MKCLITGANRGLGKELVKVFKDDYEIIPHMGKKDGDLRDDETLERLYEISSRSSDLSLLINNVGLPCGFKPFDERSDQEIREMIEVNLIAPMRLTHKLFPILRMNNGIVINISSIAGLENVKNRNIYEISKWGLRSFTNSLRIEGLRAVGVYPTRIKTNGFNEYGMEAEDVARIVYENYKEYDTIVIDGRLPQYRNTKIEDGKTKTFHMSPRE